MSQLEKNERILQVGDRVKHGFSGVRGQITNIRSSAWPYSYYVEWDYPETQDRNDWYRADALELI